MKKTFFLFILAFIQFGFTNAQSFIHLIDASGKAPTNEELTRLEIAAQQAINILPASDRPLFKIYDIGFYIPNVVTSGGTSQDWEKVKTNVENDPNSDYYLIFGRESNSELLNFKVRVKLKLPTTSIYSCLTEEERGNLEKYLEAVANENLDLP
jgi:hypothetical protein